jgi:hypothetical protein
MDKLCEKIFKIEPKIDLAHEIAGCGNFVEVTETSDGFFLGRPKGSIGFDAFLGKPSEIAKERTNNIYEKLTENEKKEFLSRIFRQNITPKDIGLLVSKVL